MQMTVGEIARAVGARNNLTPYQNVKVTSVAFNSRKLKRGGLFIPLIGKRDGHRYFPKARANGATATLWAADHHPYPDHFPVIVVTDPLRAFQQLAHYYRYKVNPKVVAITGSNGKTTTKDLTASILSTRYRVHKTPQNYNNGIGVPYTVLSMNADTQVLVVEMGMDHAGQLDCLSKIVNPDVALITMIGEAHIEHFGTRAKIADAKMEITHGLQPNGTFIFNGDEPLLRTRAKAVSQRQITFGDRNTNTLYPIKLHGTARATAFTTNRWPGMKFKIPMIGDYNVNNACAAMLISTQFGVGPESMRRGLREVTLTQNRTEWLTGKHGERILSDVYNSNPTAAKVVLATFAKTPVRGKRVAVLGDMLELGRHSQAMHASLAKYLDPQQINEVYLVGTDMAALRDQLRPKYPDSAVHYYQADQLNRLARDLSHELTNADEVLLKASHGIHLERVLAKIAKS